MNHPRDPFETRIENNLISDFGSVFHCKVCGKNFSSRQSALSHIRKFHKDTTKEIISFTK